MKILGHALNDVFRGENSKVGVDLFEEPEEANEVYLSFDHLKMHSSFNMSSEGASVELCINADELDALSIEWLEKRGYKITK